jgi:hypothetical protein
VQFDSEDWVRAWTEYATTDADPDPMPPRRSRLRERAASIRLPGVSAMLVLVVAVPFAAAQSGHGSGSPTATAAATGDALREGRRNPSSGDARRETELIARIGAEQGGSGAGKGGFALRESNLSDSGGGAVHGCRAVKGNIDTAGFDAVRRDTKPCLRVSNLSTGVNGGRAFEMAFAGPTGGLIEHESGGDGAQPFRTNATGVATGLNADRVDGREGTDLLGRTEKAADSELLDGKDGVAVASWAVVNAAGALQRSFPAGVTSLRINAGNYRADFGRNISQCAFFLTPQDPAQNLTAHAELDATDAERVFVSLRDADTAVRTDGEFQVSVQC